MVQTIDLATRCRDLHAAVETARTDAARIADQLAATLTPEQRRLLNDVRDADTGAATLFSDWLVSQIARHRHDFGIVALEEHVRAGEPGCCA